MSIIKLSEWNDLIDQINDARANPPPDTDCDPLDPIDHADPGIITKAEFQRVRDALQETCDSIEFSDFGHIIKRSLYEEILDQIGSAWCDCDDDDDCDNHCDPHGSDGTEYIVNSNDLEVFSTCPGYPDPSEADPVNVCGLVNGLNVGPPGIAGRTYGLRIVITPGANYAGGTIGVGGGLVGCDGNAVCSGSLMASIRAGISVVCGTDLECCGEPATIDSLNQAAEDITGGRIELILTVFAGSASCDTDCDGISDCEDEDFSL